MKLDDIIAAYRKELRSTTMLTMESIAKTKVERDLLLDCVRNGYAIIRDEEQMSLPLMDAWRRSAKVLLETVDEYEAEERI